MDNKEKAKEFLMEFIKPEINTELSTMQPIEVNPFERIGPVPSIGYSGVNRPDNLF